MKNIDFYLNNCWLCEKPLPIFIGSSYLTCKHDNYKYEICKYKKNIYIDLYTKSFQMVGHKNVANNVYMVYVLLAPELTKQIDLLSQENLEENDFIAVYQKYIDLAKIDKLDNFFKKLVILE